MVGISAMCVMPVFAAEKDQPQASSPFEQLAASGTSRQRPEVEPIVVRPEATLERDYKRIERAWMERMILQPLAKRVEGKTWGAEAQSFVESAMSNMIEESGEDVPRIVAARGRRLLEAGCDDPLVIFFSGWAGQWERNGRSPEVTLAALQRAMKGMEELRFPAAVRRFVASVIAGTTFSDSVQARYDAKAGELALAAVEEGNFEPGEEGVLLRQNMHYPWGGTLGRAPKNYLAVARSEKLPDWVRHTLMGIVERGLAWEARGSGWGNTVTEEGWKGFAKHLALARKELVQAWELRPDQPYAATSMIKVVMGGDNGENETARLWLDRATAAQFDFFPAYMDIMYAWMPRWGGSHEIMLEFGRICRATGRYDTEVPRVFTLACNQIAGDLEDWRAFYRDPQNKELAREMLDHHRKLLAEPSRKARSWADRSAFAVNSWFVGDFAAAAEALSNLPEGLYYTSVKRLRNEGIDPNRFGAEVALLNSPARNACLRAEDLVREEKPAQAKRLLEPFQDKVSGAALDALKSRLAALSVAEKLDSGDWVSLPAGPELPGWQILDGKWTGTADGALVLTGENSIAAALLEVPFGGDFEIRGDFQAEGKEPTFGVVLGYNNHAFPRSICATIWVTDGQVFGGMLHNFANFGEPVKLKPLQANNQFKIQVVENRTTFEVNGEKVLDRFLSQTGKPSTEGSKIGFGGHEFAGGDTITIRNLQLRKLPE